MLHKVQASSVHEVLNGCAKQCECYTAACCCERALPRSEHTTREAASERVIVDVVLRARALENALRAAATREERKANGIKQCTLIRRSLLFQTSDSYTATVFPWSGSTCIARRHHQSPLRTTRRASQLRELQQLR